MFCQKCGNKLEEDAVFCTRCGTKQPVEIKAEQTVESNAESTEQKAEKQTLPVHSRKTLKNVYDQIRENSAHCPEIRSVVLKESKSGVLVAGKYSKYWIAVSGNLISLSSSPGILLAIPFWLCFVLYSLAFFCMAADTPVCWGAWGLGILLNLYGYYIASVTNKEKKTVLSFVKTVLGQSKYNEIPRGFEIFICSLVMFMGVLCLALMAMMYGR